MLLTTSLVLANYFQQIESTPGPLSAAMYTVREVQITITYIPCISDGCHRVPQALLFPLEKIVG